MLGFEPCIFPKLASLIFFRLEEENNLMELAEILSSGCDERVLIDPKTNLNKYYLNPTIYEGYFFRGSCTCATLNEETEPMVRDFIERCKTTDVDTIIAEQTRRVKKLLVPEKSEQFDVYFGPSGSDLMYYPLLFMHVMHPGEEIISIVTCPEELGSGSLIAAQGRFFNSKNQFGEAVQRESLLHDSIKVKTITIPARDAHGNILDRREQIGEIIRANPGKPIIGNLVFGSKSGIKDDLNVIDDFPTGVLWAVDLCQLRNTPSLIKSLLEKGCMVLITGSKFYQSPPFCGAMLVPKKLSEEMVAADARNIKPFEKVFSKYDLPTWMTDLRENLTDFNNLGFRARWECSIYEMEKYDSLPRKVTNRVISAWNRFVTSWIEESEFLELIPDQHKTNQTIISFRVKVNGKFLSLEELKELFKRVVTSDFNGLGIYNKAFMGQPVTYGERAFIRLALGSFDIRTILASGGYDPALDNALLEHFIAKLKEIYYVQAQ